jgi:hypothetical protein
MDAIYLIFILVGILAGISATLTYLNVNKPDNIIYTTIEEKNKSKLFDYPKYLPIPRLNEFVIFNDISGYVISIRHITDNTVTEIKITLSNYE